MQAVGRGDDHGVQAERPAVHRREQFLRRLVDRQPRRQRQPTGGQGLGPHPGHGGQLHPRHGPRRQQRGVLAAHIAHADDGGADGIFFHGKRLLFMRPGWMLRLRPAPRPGFPSA